MTEQIVTPMQIYLLTRCDAIRDWLWSIGGLVAISFAGLLASIALAIVSFTIINDFLDGHDEEYVERAKNTIRLWAKRSAVVGIAASVLASVSTLAAAFIPTNREMAAIIVVPRIANSQSVQEIGSGIVGLAKEWMDELSPKKNGNAAKAAGEEAKCTR